MIFGFDSELFSSKVYERAHRKYVRTSFRFWRQESRARRTSPPTSPPTSLPIGHSATHPTSRLTSRLTSSPTTCPTGDSTTYSTGRYTNRSRAIKVLTLGTYCEKLHMAAWHWRKWQAQVRLQSLLSSNSCEFYTPVDSQLTKESAGASSSSTTYCSCSRRFLS